MPIDFTPSDDSRAVVKGITEFADRQAAKLHQRFPGWAKAPESFLEPDGRVRADLVDAVKDVRRKSAEAGFYALAMPTEVGGGGRPMVDAALAMAALCERGYNFHSTVLAFVDGPVPMMTAMDATQRKRWLDPLIRAETFGAFALTEPGAGSDVGAMRTHATKKNGRWTLNGSKTLITGAPYADVIEVFARTSGDRGLDGLSLFMVDRDLDGVEVGAVQRTIIDDGSQADIHFRDVEVDEEALVSGEGEGFPLAIMNIGLTRVLIGAMCLGYARFCLNTAVEYARSREAFGRSIGKYQGLSFPLADAATRIYAAENMLLNCAWRLDQGEPCIAESSMVKVYATEMAFDVADAAIQVHGGTGVTREVPLERILRLARGLRIAEGTSEIQRSTIAKVLGL